MQVSRIQSFNYTNFNNIKGAQNDHNINLRGAELPIKKDLAKVPVGFKYGANIHFGEYIDPNRTVPHIDYEEYLALSGARKTRLRARYKTFLSRKTNQEGLYDNKYTTNPLSNEKKVEAFFDVAKMYNK